ncbi:hypothetical protein [Halorhabdus rudnickae]|nr:hypothetical protein [Halorhabdus rudnickae]
MTSGLSTTASLALGGLFVIYLLAVVAYYVFDRELIPMPDLDTLGLP